MKVSFPYEERPSSLFGEVKRPVARVQFWSKKLKRYLEYVAIVDTGADYTLLPRHVAIELGIDLHRECKTFSTYGVGGSEKVYFLLRRLAAKIGPIEKTIPIAFLAREDIPLLLGRESCLNDLDVRLYQFMTTLSSIPKSRK